MACSSCFQPSAAVQASHLVPLATRFATRIQNAQHLQHVLPTEHQINYDTMAYNASMRPRGVAATLLHDDQHHPISRQRAPPSPSQQHLTPQTCWQAETAEQLDWTERPPELLAAPPEPTDAPPEPGVAAAGQPLDSWTAVLDWQHARRGCFLAQSSAVAVSTRQAASRHQPWAARHHKQQVTGAGFCTNYKKEHQPLRPATQGQNAVQKGPNYAQEERVECWHNLSDAASFCAAACARVGMATCFRYGEARAVQRYYAVTLHPCAAPATITSYGTPPCTISCQGLGCTIMHSCRHNTKLPFHTVHCVTQGIPA